MNSPIETTEPTASIFRLAKQVESTAALNIRSEPSSFPSTPTLGKQARLNARRHELGKSTKTPRIIRRRAWLLARPDLSKDRRDSMTANERRYLWRFEWQKLSGSPPPNKVDHRETMALAMIHRAAPPPNENGEPLTDEQRAEWRRERNRRKRERRAGR